MLNRYTKNLFNARNNNNNNKNIQTKKREGKQ